VDLFVVRYTRAKCKDTGCPRVMGETVCRVCGKDIYKRG